jgi:hypothetical protein
LKGGNEYPEGRRVFKRSWAGTRVKGRLSNHSYLQPQGQADEWESDIECDLGVGDLDENKSD